MEFRKRSWVRDATTDDEGMPRAPREALIQLLEMIPTVLNAKLIPISDGSRMAEDRAAMPTDLFDLPSMCEHYIGSSEDFLTGILQLMHPRPNTLQLPRFSLYPLIRGVIESSGQTVWVLGPDDQRDRFRRLLQIQKDELDYDVKYTDVLTELRAGDKRGFRSLSTKLREESELKRRKRWKRLLDAAAVLTIEQREFEHGVRGGYTAIIREACDEQNLDRDFHGRECASIWMYISGLTHPSMWRAWGGSIREPGEVEPDGKMHVWSEADPVVVRDALRVAVGLTARAFILWKDACAAAPPPGDDG